MLKKWEKISHEHSISLIIYFFVQKFSVCLHSCTENDASKQKDEGGNGDEIVKHRQFQQGWLGLGSKSKIRSLLWSFVLIATKKLRLNDSWI